MFTNNKWLKDTVTGEEELQYIRFFVKEVERLLALKGIYKIWGNNRKILETLSKEISSMEHFYKVVLRVNELCKLEKCLSGSFQRQLAEGLLYAIGIDPYQSRHFNSVNDPVLYFSPRFGFFDQTFLYECSLQKKAKHYQHHVPGIKPGTAY